MAGREWTWVGATQGLTHPCSDTEPEQVYVYTQPDCDRPILIEGWKGYSVPQRLRLTKLQAHGLRDLLNEALEGDLPPPHQHTWRVVLTHGQTGDPVAVACGGCSDYIDIRRDQS